MSLARTGAAIALTVALPLAAHADPLTVETVEALFSTAQIVSGPEIVDCTLSGGAQTECVQLTVKPEPTNYVAGPWCPTNIEDGPDKAGIWFYDGEVVDADGAFFSSLSALYNDDNWQVFDPETGDIYYTATLEACEGAARPDVDPEYQNHCVQCLLDYVDEDIAVTYSFPVEPVDADRDGDIRMTGAGVAFNGIRIDGPAPVDAILGAYTVAVFDDCGGHVNLHVGYHYHAVDGDCLPHGQHDDAAHANVIGLAMDGHFIAEHLNIDGTEPEGLDACFGHATDDMDYHYHVGKAGTNQNLGCLAAQAGCSNGEAGQACDATARPPRP